MIKVVTNDGAHKRMKYETKYCDETIVTSHQIMPDDPDMFSMKREHM